ncbi:acyltransferase family protein [Shinella zoogloeoides]|uniref:acyltransferase family protein n=1 Tax=Shinella zoogloeoides TaxID=352475 RepID=UPI0028AD1807|nr:acyltransferase family protein [Shinella zoogloeoides]
MSYRPEIDGLRAIAVLPVLFFHAGFGWAKGGFVGVDIFFVISGFLITSILLKDLQHGNFSIIDFYDRRLRRIVPALFLVCAATIPPAWLWMLPQEFDDYAQSLFATSASVSNFVFWQESGYFDAATELKPLLHTWSLAVEEQYYLISPPILALLFRANKITLGITALSLASFGLTQILAYTAPAANFYLLPTRFWELGLGALLATGLLQRISNATIRNLAALAGLILIVGSILWIDGSRPYPGWWTLPAVIGTALVISCATQGTYAAQLLSLRPAVFVGLISYSVYLWHQPVFAFARIRSLDEVSDRLFFLLIILSLVLGYLSWRFVEQPFRDRRRVSRKWIFANTAIFGVALFGFGLTMDLLEPNNLRARTPALESMETRMRPNYGIGDGCANANPVPEKCSTSNQPDLLLWGDSFAMHLADSLLGANPHAKIVQLTKSVCGPFLDFALVSLPDRPLTWARGCHAFNKDVANFIEKTPSLRYVVLSAALNRYVETGTSALVDDEVVPSNPQLVTTALLGTMRWLRTRGLQPVFVNAMPRDGRNVGVCAARSLWIGIDGARCAIDRKAADIYAASYATVLQTIRKEFPVIDFAEAVCSAQSCPVAIEGTLLYRDAGHLSYEGSRYLGQKLDLYRLVTESHPHTSSNVP